MKPLLWFVAMVIAAAALWVILVIEGVSSADSFVRFLLISTAGGFAAWGFLRWGTVSGLKPVLWFLTFLLAAVALWIAFLGVQNDRYELAAESNLSLTTVLDRRTGLLRFMTVKEGTWTIVTVDPVTGTAKRAAVEMEQASRPPSR
jgi:hypothetical protein